MADEKSPNPLAEALRTQIIEIVSTGGELTPEALAKIMRIAKTGRDLLVSLSASPSNLAGMMKRRGGFGVQLSDGSDDLSDSDGPIQMAMPMAYSSPNENFGMTALREIIAAVRTTNGSDTPVKLVEALVAARAAGLNDVAKELERKLGVGKEKVEPKPVPEEKKGNTP